MNNLTNDLISANIQETEFYKVWFIYGPLAWQASLVSRLDAFDKQHAQVHLGGMGLVSVIFEVCEID